ncbi:hypothetical protein [uncultured Thiodictyon sp.]|uniref:hypothetical protein n=1 Tax=uncultured Thiodictyon sp. TaxID=1846217 RepID=UPI0025D53342|nr:hypothetical protein [uncultured Thiodictyon sp.]
MLIGLVWGLLLGLYFDLVWGLYIGLLMCLGLSLAVSFSTGFAVSVGFMIGWLLGYYRVPFYFIQAPVALFRLDMRHNPYLWDGAVRLPLWGARRRLTDQVAADPETGAAFVLSQSQGLGTRVEGSTAPFPRVNRGCVRTPVR